MALTRVVGCLVAAVLPRGGVKHPLSRPRAGTREGRHEPSGRSRRTRTRARSMNTATTAPTRSSRPLWRRKGPIRPFWSGTATATTREATGAPNKSTMPSRAARTTR